MKLLQEVNSWLESTYALLDTNTTKPKEFPLLLIVKEVVLDILWVNSWKKLSEKAKKIIDSTDIDEIVWALKTPRQKERFMELFDQNPEASFLNFSWTINNYNTKFYKASIDSDEKKWLSPNWRASYNLWINLLNLWKYQEAIIHLRNSLIDAPKDFLVSIYTNLWFCYKSLWEFERSIQYYFTALLGFLTNEEFWEICNYIWEVYAYDWKYKEAIKYLEIALDKNPNLDEKWKIYARLWISYYCLWKYEEARKYLLSVYTDKTIPNNVGNDVRIKTLDFLKKLEEVDCM